MALVSEYVSPYLLKGSENIIKEEVRRVKSQRAGRGWWMDETWLLHSGAHPSQELWLAANEELVRPTAPLISQWQLMATGERMSFC